MELTSRAFRSGEEIPRRYTADGEAISPPLAWSGVPGNTREFALICEDPDAPLPRSFVHWIIFGLGENTSELPEGLPAQRRLLAPIAADQGTNSLLRRGYTPPNPPFWHGPHRYVFRLFALDQPLELPAGAGRAAFFRALRGHVLAVAVLEGRYQRQVPVRLRGLERFWRKPAPGRAAA